MKLHLIVASLLLFQLSACNGTTQKVGTKQSTIAEKTPSIPMFNADSAYNFVAKQTAFGPRIPASDAHRLCSDWLRLTLQAYTETVVVQPFRARAFNGKVLDGQNIIASFNPKANKRIFLSSHWDSRPFGDHDPDPAKRSTPIDGANDGASGVGILLEIARQLKLHPIDANLGIDFVLFDLEDYGPPTDERAEGDDFWALGSQYWAANPHTPAYQAQFGILLDMVGASNAVFPREYFSMQYASWVVDKVWSVAYDLGYDDVFVNSPGAPVDDDHLPINKIANIPTIDIIHLDRNSTNGTFYEHWHTTKDNLEQIDPVTLGMVGTVLVHVIYSE